MVYNVPVLIVLMYVLLLVLFIVHFGGFLNVEHVLYLIDVKPTQHFINLALSSFKLKA